MGQLRESLGIRYALKSRKVCLFQICGPQPACPGDEPEGCRRFRTGADRLEALSIRGFRRARRCRADAGALPTPRRCELNAVPKRGRADSNNLGVRGAVRVRAGAGPNALSALVVSKASRPSTPRGSRHNDSTIWDDPSIWRRQRRASRRISRPPVAGRCKPVRPPRSTVTQGAAAGRPDTAFCSGNSRGVWTTTSMRAGDAPQSRSSRMDGDTSHIGTGLNGFIVKLCIDSVFAVSGASEWRLHHANATLPVGRSGKTRQARSGAWAAGQ